MHRILIVLLLFPVVSKAQDVHPAMESKWWANAGSYLAKRDLDASASGSVSGFNREFDLEGSLGLDDAPSVFMAELGWQFSENWGAALQYFRSSRSGSRTLDESFEWQGNTYDVGAVLEAETEMDITRIFFARRFRDEGPHSLRLGAGFHWLDISAAVAGQATQNDQSTEFRRSAAKASVPVPNIGAWYRYSPNDRWLLSARIDWLSASIDNYSGDIWNVSAGANFRLWDHVGVGASYQYFELAGSLKEDSWRGDIKTTFSGPYLYVSAFW